MNNITLNQILEELKSDYIPIQIQAADNFIEQGFSTENLLKVIQTERNFHFINMYFYICGKTHQADKAWAYMCFNNDNRFFDAAIKYLMKEDLLDDFINHMIEVKQILNQKRSNLLREDNKRYSDIIAVQSVNEIDINLWKELTTPFFMARYAIETAYQNEYKHNGYFEPLTEEEIEIASNISVFHYIMRCDVPSELQNYNTYQNNLKKLLEKISRYITDTEYLKTKLTPDLIEKMIGIDKSYINNFFEYSLLSLDEYKRKF